MTTSPAEARGPGGDEVVAWLRSPEAVRERCSAVFAAAEDDGLEHFVLDLARLPQAARAVVDEIRRNYPDLEVPYHSRWRHFAAGGRDRWAELAARLRGAPPERIARLRIELAAISVLLDAGAGSDWRYHAPGGDTAYGRSEGLALASLELFAAGALSGDPADPLRADAQGLGSVTAARLAEAFQVRPDNPLVGLPGRVELLRRLGDALCQAPALFGAQRPRIGGLYDHFIGRARAGRLPAREILGALLDGLGPIWPGRITLHGVNLGDVWRHPAARAPGPSDGLVPFHKLSQWLAYSLVEPLEQAGLTVTDLDALTGLAEYRNGGLFLDFGVIKPRRASLLEKLHQVEEEPIVEWRALTVVLLDRVADLVRVELGLDAARLPLAKVLQGGTWSAGRRIARERRSDGAPPIRVASDGTVF